MLKKSLIPTLLVVLMVTFRIQSAKHSHIRELLSLCYWRSLSIIGSALRIVHRY